MNAFLSKVARLASCGCVFGLWFSASCRGADAVVRPPGTTATVADDKSDPAKDKIVFEALDLSQPELAQVASAVNAGQYEKASHAWATYLRGRPGISWEDHVPGGAERRVADEAVRGRVTGGYVPVAHSFGDGKIDWFYNATGKTKDSVYNREWQWQLNRMFFWPDMAAAYTATKDEIYPKAFASQLRSWIDQCPMPASVQNKEGSAWRTIEVGIRMGQTWPTTFSQMLPSASLSDAVIMDFTRSTLEQAHYLRKNHTDVNWLLIEMNGLMAAGCLFPEFKEASDWRTYALAKINEEGRGQFLPDGAQDELSTGYLYDVIIPSIFKAARMASSTGHSSEIPADYLNMLKGAYEWIMCVTPPDLNRPKINDSWPGKVDYVFRAAAELFPGREDFEWFATDRKQGHAPEKISAFLDWSGFAVMRSDWTPESNYLIFDVGPLGYGGHMVGVGHAHQDKLNVSLWTYGREQLFDGGGSSYVFDKWRVWSRSSLSHNTVLVDGLGQNRQGNPSGEQRKNPSKISQTPIDAGWQTSALYDFATGVYDEEYGTSEYGPPGVYDPAKGNVRKRIADHRRSVLFLKPDIYIVADRMEPLDAQAHTYQARWQLLSTHTEDSPETKALATADAGVSNLAIVPLLTDGLQVRHATAQETPELLGWHCRKDMKPQNVPATTLLQTKEGTGVQRFLTLLLPLKKDEKNPVVSATGANPVKVIFRDGRKLVVEASKDGRGIEVTETMPDGSVGRHVSAGAALKP